MENIRNRGPGSDQDKANDTQNTPEGMSSPSKPESEQYIAGSVPEGLQNPSHYPRVDPTQYKNANEYAQAVQQWLWQYQMWNQMNWFYMTFPFYAMSCMPPLSQPQSAFSSQVGTTLPANFSAPNLGAGIGQGAAIRQPQQAAQAQRRNAQQTPTEFRIPPLWRRVLAEFIDFFILFVVKLAVTIMTVEYIGIVDLEKYDIENLMSQNLDYNAAFAMTSELVAMEIINRIFICIFETLCLRRGIAGMVGGTTPGKRMMGLKVVSCDEVVSLGGNRVRVIPARDIGFCNALVRSVIKNFSLAFFFPVCFTVFFFQHNRAAYDVIASCIVVEATEEDLMLHRRR